MKLMRGSVKNWRELVPRTAAHVSNPLRRASSTIKEPMNPLAPVISIFNFLPFYYFIFLLFTSYLVDGFASLIVQVDVAVHLGINRTGTHDVSHVDTCC